MALSAPSVALLSLFLAAAGQEQQAATGPLPQAAANRDGNASSAEAIDWARAQTLLNREKAGAELSPEDHTYLEHAKAVRRQTRERGNASAQPGSKSIPSGSRATPPPAKPSTGLKPLSEMSEADRYLGEDGGLYGHGRNEPPPEHARAAERAASQIVPLDAQGHPALDGKVVAISIGMSNTTIEFSGFVGAANRDPQKARQLVIVDGAQRGRTASNWAGREGPPPGMAARSTESPWDVLDGRMRRAEVTAQQVQVLWMKQANRFPSEPFPKHARELAADLTKIVQLAKQRFPNLRMAYLSSRIYGGYATTGLNPEPYAYEGAFAVRWVIQSQRAGDAQLNYDPGKGGVKAPVLLWGPYLWADGMTPRKPDGLTWTRDELRDTDGTHPSDGPGRDKVARLLLDFFKSEPTAKLWFTGSPGAH